ncbi:MAG: LysM peptidoglycan-binding domain-containing protein [Candidatus Cloacimonadota bacterium]|nr:LysM peptidoglycan-binding domain-containing protein [Candidatus Cloacimonadota bacterium]
MRKYLSILLILTFAFGILNAEVIYKSEEEYKELSKNERLDYWNDLETEMIELQKSKADAIANKEKVSIEVDNLNAELAKTKADYEKIYNEILKNLGIDKNDLRFVKQKIKFFNSKIANWKSLSDDELWEANKSIKEFVEDYNTYRGTNIAKAPDFRNDFSDLDRKVLSLQEDVRSAKPRYFEDEYTVKRGDFLSKISGYEYIYNDPSKWGIIYRANRDRIKDPNIISVDQVIKIPRGLPHSWKVYNGEFLWKIASYPEVYGNGTLWPKIYRANKDQIKDPNLIYPNQKLTIPRD